MTTLAPTYQRFVVHPTAMLGLAEGVQRGIMDSFRLLGGASLQIHPNFDRTGPATTLTMPMPTPYATRCPT